MITGIGEKRTPTETHAWGPRRTEWACEAAASTRTHTHAHARPGLTWLGSQHRHRALLPRVVVESGTQEPAGPGFKPWIRCWLAGGPQARNLTSLSLLFLNRKVQTINYNDLTLFVLALCLQGLSLQHRSCTHTPPTLWALVGADRQEASEQIRGRRLGEKEEEVPMPLRPSLQG